MILGYSVVANDVMKTASCTLLLAFTCVLSNNLSAGLVARQASDAGAAPASTEYAAPGPAAPAHLPGSTAEIVNLSKAGVAEDTIIAYVVNSGRTYNLSATDIINLKHDGVSDAVLTAMLQQTQRAAQAAAAAGYAQPAANSQY